MIKHTRSLRRAALLLAILALAAVTLAACQPTETLTERVVQGDWSRGIQVGTASQNDGAPLAVSSIDGAIRVFWVAAPAAGESSQPIYVAHLDASGRLLASGPLPFDTLRPSRLSLETAPSGTILLFWLDAASGRNGLWCAPVAPDGATGAPAALVGAATGVQAFATAPDPSGGVHVVWSADEASGRGLSYLHVDESGVTDAASAALGVAGLVPSMRADADGLLHIAWSDQPDFGLRDILYATLDPASGTLSEVTRLASLPLPTGQVLRDPTVGLTQDGVTVFWAIERRGGGLVPPSSESRYVFIPGGRASEATAPTEVIVPPTREPAVVAVGSQYALSRLAPVAADDENSEFVYYAAPLSTPGDELAVAVSAQLVGRTQSNQQIVLTLWSGGHMTGYQVVAQSPGTSIRPALAADSANNLYVSWIDTAGFGAYDVYVAGTSDAMRATLDRWRLYDVGVAILNALWGIVQAAGFLPMAVMWIAPALIVLAIYAVLQPEGDLARRGPRIMLIVAGLLYQATKVLFRPTWLSDFPVPGWVDPALADRVVLLAPLGIAVLAGLLTALWVRRRAYPSLFPTFAVFVGCDVLLTLLLYVPAVLSE